MQFIFKCNSSEIAQASVCRLYANILFHLFYFVCTRALKSDFVSETQIDIVSHVVHIARIGQLQKYYRLDFGGGGG